MKKNLQRSLWTILFISVGLASDAFNVLDHTKQFYTSQNTTKEIELRKLFHYVNMKKSLESMTNQLVLNMKVTYPEMNNEKFDKYMKNIMSSKKIEELYIDIYSKHYTLNEILELNKIYSSEEMQKLLKVTPQITTDIGTEIVKLLKSESDRLKQN